ncbi:hypothetical protein EG240_04820 [Paenimyroides tangerinum]|uniref:Uncharacterized protein n=1 Tax=Paenimyroides tangerinum TaxID=2488728 RepID=A0A3P3WB51_9FLAO|nr:hypothetical protein [Paenimyroides tangerinum]RRJ91884.1 hypothetical protein EG240_04820 [Paenimyroides tangerinum]
MRSTYTVLIFTSIFLASALFSFRLSQKNGTEFRYNPILLLVIFVLFLVSLYGSITGTPYDEIVPFIG